MSSFENQRIYQKKQLPVMKTTYRNRRLACYTYFVLVIIYVCRYRRAVFFVMLATFQNSTFGLYSKYKAFLID